MNINITPDVFFDTFVKGQEAMDEVKTSRDFATQQQVGGYSVKWLRSNPSPLEAFELLYSSFQFRDVAQQAARWNVLVMVLGELGFKSGTPSYSEFMKIVSSPV